jgi:hypothetical protein
MRIHHMLQRMRLKRNIRKLKRRRALMDEAIAKVAIIKLDCRRIG